MTESLLSLTVLILATYRLTRLIYADDITSRARQKIWKRATKQGRWSKIAGWLHELVTCPHCVSVWAAPVVFLVALIPVIGWPLVVIGSVAGAVSLVYTVLSYADDLVQ